MRMARGKLRPFRHTPAGRHGTAPVGHGTSAPQRHPPHPPQGGDVVRWPNDSARWRKCWQGRRVHDAQYGLAEAAVHLGWHLASSACGAPPLISHGGGFQGPHAHHLTYPRPARNAATSMISTAASIATVMPVIPIFQ